MLASGTISEIALIFVSNENFDTQINKALEIVGNHLGVSRSYIFLDSLDGTTTSNTHEWCAAGVDPQIEKMQNVPYSTIPVWKETLEHERVHAINDVSSEEVVVREMLEPMEIRALIVAPLRADNHIFGFLGFDECRHPRVWNEAEIETLKIISGIITTALFRKQISDKLTASEENFRTFFDTVDDIIVIADLDGKLLFANGGAVRKLGYSIEEICNKHILDLHPADKRQDAEKILGQMFRGERTICPLELAANNGSRIPVETRIWFGKWNGHDCIFGLSKDLSAEQSALQKFERLFRNNPASMAVSTVSDSLFIDVNDTFLEKYGYTREEAIGHSGIELGLFANDEQWNSIKEELARTNTVRNRNLVLRHKNGNLVYGIFSGDIIDLQGQRVFLSVTVDISKQIELLGELSTEHSRLMNIIEGTKLGTWDWNVQTGETTYNDRWAEIVGYNLEELAPISIKTWERLVHPDDLDESDRLLKRHFDGLIDFYEYECRMRHKNGKWIWVHDRGKVIERDYKGRPLKMYGTHADITEKKAMEQQIRELAVRDPLTEVYNRRYIFEHLDKIVIEYSRTGRNFCVTIIDIDHFKLINDTYGHQSGDVILKEFAHTISSSIRQYDLLGRYGGEEFIIISTSTSGHETTTLIERIMELVRKKVFPFEGHEIRFTFSGGLADSVEFTHKAITAEAMMALADKRLYAAKEAGRDRFFGPGKI